MKRLMTHVVVGNPTLATTKRLVREMITRDITAIELQIPFSDPIADGPVLMAANDAAVKKGISVDDMLNILEATDSGDTKLYIMSYLQPILHYGPKAFFDRALKAGCSGFIIPDLPFDTPETKDFIANQPELRHMLVPVLSPGMTDDRLVQLFKTLKPKLIYLTARHGITGEHTQFNNNLEKTIQNIRTYSSDATLAIGFGIQTPADVRAVLRFADLAVIGSALTRALGRSEAEALKFIDLA